MILSKAECTERRLDKELEAIANKLNLESIDEALYFPRFVQLETTRLCNAQCPMCLIDKWDKSVPFMSDELFNKLATELCEYSDWIRWVCVQKAGEPMLDKKIGSRIKRLKAGGIQSVTMSTNASALTEKRSREILEAGIDDLMISFDSIDKKEYEAIRVGLNYENVLANIRRYFKLRDEVNPSSIIRVKGVHFFDPNDPKQIEYRQTWEEFWEDERQPHDRIYMKPAHTWGNQIELGDQAVDHGAEILHPCIMPWSTIQITAMGTICLCPHVYDAIYDLGNLVDQSIAEVWRSSALERIRRLHSTGERNDIPLCVGCVTYDEEFALEKDRPPLFSEEAVVNA